MRDGDGSFPESIPEPPPDHREMPHAAGAGGLPPAGLDGPSVLPGLGSGIAASGANLLLDVEGHSTASAAQSVRLVVTLTKRTRSLRLK